MRRAPDKPDPSAVEKAASFLTPAGKLPGFAQRRLDQLIDQGKTGKLNRTEQRELREMLSFIDQKTISLLKLAATRRNVALSAE